MNKCVEVRDMRLVQEEYRWQYEYYLKRVEKLLGDDDKALEWMQEDNPMLGDMSPVSMIAHGRANRLERFINECEKVTAKG